MIDFSNKIYELRSGRKMSQVDLARKLGVSKQTISSYENGTRSPNNENLVDIAKMFHVSLDYLFGLSDRKRRINVDRLTQKQINIVEDLVEELEKVNSLKIKS